MVEHNVRLTSAEIGGLWEAYYQLTMSMCLNTYFLHHLKDEDIKTLLQETERLINDLITEVTAIFSAENIPLPDGFTDKDIDLTAPKLFYDPFALSFIYMLSRMCMINYSFVLSNMARSDIVAYFSKSMKRFVDLYSKSVHLMLSKGLYDRPTTVPYPERVEYIQKKSYPLGFIGNKRPLNTVELAEIFFNIERNYFSVLFCLGLLQVVKDEEIKEFIKDGKKISEKQIKLLNKTLMEEDLLGKVTVNMEVTDSTVSPFSNKLIMALFTFLNSIDITLIGHALSLSMRADLSAISMNFIKDILIYMEKGFSIMVNRKWLEQPPQAPNRKELQKSSEE
jgi:hypothetical protein